MRNSISILIEKKLLICCYPYIFTIAQQKENVHFRNDGNRLFSCIFCCTCQLFFQFYYTLFTIFSPISSIRLLDCKFQSCFLSIVKFHSDHCTSFPDGFHVSLCIHRGNFFPAAIVSDAECGTSGRKFHPKPEGFSFFQCPVFCTDRNLLWCLSDRHFDAAGLLVCSCDRDHGISFFLCPDHTALCDTCHFIVAAFVSHTLICGISRCDHRI